MNKTRRKRSATFKTKVVLDMLKETQTLAQLSGKHGVSKMKNEPQEVNMIKKKRIVGAVTLFFSMLPLWCGVVPPEEPEQPFPTLKGEYLGQKRPGLTPEIFAPGIVSTRLVEATITFSPDGKEFYFTRWNQLKGGNNTIWMGKIENQQWTAPKVAPFSGKYFDYESHISPDGKRLYFGTTRPFQGDGPPIDEHEWVLEKTAAGWSTPKPLGSPFKERFVMYATEAKNRNIYFSGKKPNSNSCEICVSRWIDGKYQEPGSLSQETINRFFHAAHPFIAPDESYLIYDARVTSNSPSNLYISARKRDGTWIKSKPLGQEINTSNEEMCATVSPDGQYLFFSRGPHIYWVDAKILENYKKE